jgi:hypothetical protein
MMFEDISEVNFYRIFRYDVRRGQAEMRHLGKPVDTD